MSSFSISQKFLNHSISKKAGKTAKKEEDNVFDSALLQAQTQTLNFSSSSSSSSSLSLTSNQENKSNKDNHRVNQRVFSIKLQKAMMKSADHF